MMNKFEEMSRDFHRAIIIEGCGENWQFEHMIESNVPVLLFPAKTRHHEFIHVVCDDGSDRFGRKHLKFSVKLVKLDFVERAWNFVVYRKPLRHAPWYPSWLYKGQAVLQLEENLNNLFNQWWP